MSSYKTVSAELWAFLRLLFDNNYRTKDELLAALSAAELETGEGAWSYLEMFRKPALELNVGDRDARRKLSDDAQRVREELRHHATLQVPSRR